MSQGALLIDGAWIQGQGTAFSKTNPVNNQQIWAGHEASQADVEAGMSCCSSGISCLGTYAVRRSYRNY